jgi:leucyl/phenylalanyl-tRNA--protein transferase
MQFLSHKIQFPAVDHADESGLLAIGGDLHPERLLLAYRSGIFPWYSEGEPICWFSPDPRFVLFPSEIRISKSMQQFIRKKELHFKTNTAFKEVISFCQQVKRDGQDGTWITEEMKAAYIQLHELGYAYSAEAWNGNKLVGGLYGLKLGHIFFGESMFSHQSNASKFAFIKYVQQLQKENIQLIDCQVYTEHLESLGAKMIPRKAFISILQQLQHS